MIMRLIAPGPAVTGIARGTIATESRSEASSISSLVCLVRLVRAWSIDQAIEASSRPPAMRSAGMLTEKI